MLKKLFDVVAGKMRQASASGTNEVVMLLAFVRGIAVAADATLSACPTGIALTYKTLKLAVYGGSADCFTASV